MQQFKMTYIALRQRLSTRDLSTIILTVGLLTVYFLPQDLLYNNTTSFCIHKNLFHFDCPGCGMTRALNSSLHGQFSQAIAFNAGIVPFLLLIFQHYFSYINYSHFIETFRKISIWLLTTTLLIQYILKTIHHFS